MYIYIYIHIYIYVYTVGALRQGRVIRLGAPCATQDLKSKDTLANKHCQQAALTNIYGGWWVRGVGEFGVGVFDNS